jgi:hypothetical protein
MGAFHTYLDLHNGLRGTILFAGLFVGSIALYMVAAFWLVGIPGARPNFFLDWVLPSCFLFVTLTSGFGMGWILYRPGARGLWATFSLVLGAILIGTILVSVAIWRGHWMELVREIFRSTGATR